MSWIDDVRSELKQLKTTARELRKFAYLVGAAFLLVGGAGVFKHWHGSVVAACWLIAAVLAAFGSAKPKVLRMVYMAWMGFAFAVGWIVSRAILILLFYLVITPIGAAARLFGKKFIDNTFPAPNESSWVMRDKSKIMDYEKMF